MRTFIGIDPGAQGGIAVISAGKAEAYPVSGMTLLQQWDILRRFKWPEPESQTASAVIEKNTGYAVGRKDSPTHGYGPPGSMMYSFGASFGGLRAFLIAAAIPFEEISPQRWQGAFGLKRLKGETRTTWKGRLKAVAQRLFPDLRVTLATSDALLMAEFRRRQQLPGATRRRKSVLFS